MTQEFTLPSTPGDEGEMVSTEESRGWVWRFDGQAASVRIEAVCLYGSRRIASLVCLKVLLRTRMHLYDFWVSEGQRD